MKSFLEIKEILDKVIEKFPEVAAELASAK